MSVRIIDVVRSLTGLLPSRTFAVGRLDIF